MRSKKKKCTICKDCNMDALRPVNNGHETECVCKDPIDVNFDAVADALVYEEDHVIDNIIPAVAKHGFLAENGFINTTDNGKPELAAFIPAKALLEPELNPSTSASTVLVNTINDGFHYVSVAEDGRTIDMGKVVTPCIVGNAMMPDGLYIPFTDKAIINGYHILDNTYNSMVQYYDYVNNSPAPQQPDTVFLIDKEDEF